MHRANFVTNVEIVVGSVRSQITPKDFRLHFEYDRTSISRRKDSITYDIFRLYLFKKALVSCTSVVKTSLLQGISESEQSAALLLK